MPIEFDLVSGAAIRLHLFAADTTPIGVASGFVLAVDHQHYIVTNWHVISGRDVNTRAPLASRSEPNLIKTAIHCVPFFGSARLLDLWKTEELPLYDENGQPEWIELKRDYETRSIFDIVAIPLKSDYLKGSRFNAEALRAVLSAEERNAFTGAPRIEVSALPWSWIGGKAAYGPSDPVQIVGYPTGLPVRDEQEGPINAYWQTGFIASRINAFEAGRAFLVDALADEGMCGAPVIGLKDGQQKLLGVYGGRYSEEMPLNVGIVWLADSIKALLELRGDR
jgi:hypothetical protein